MLTQSFNHVSLMNAIDVDPRHRGLVLERKTLLNLFGLFLFKLGFIVVKDSNPWLPTFFLTDINDGSRRKTDFASSPLDNMRYRSSPRSILRQKCL